MGGDTTSQDHTKQLYARDRKHIEDVCKALENIMVLQSVQGMVS